MKKWSDTVTACTIALDLNEGHSNEALANRGDAYLNQEEFEKAKHDYQKAAESDQQNRRVYLFDVFLFNCVLFSMWKGIEKQRL